jgi:hypothetical protein
MTPEGARGAAYRQVRGPPGRAVGLRRGRCNLPDRLPRRSVASELRQRNGVGREPGRPRAGRAAGDQTQHAVDRVGLGAALARHDRDQANKRTPRPRIGRKEPDGSPCRDRPGCGRRCRHAPAGAHASGVPGRRASGSAHGRTARNIHASWQRLYEPHVLPQDRRMLAHWMSREAKQRPVLRVPHGLS